MILNLTQHSATPEQKLAGVVDLGGEELTLLKNLLTFDVLPSEEEIHSRAVSLGHLVSINGLGEEGDDPWPTAVMIGGAPYLMGPMTNVLKGLRLSVLFAFSQRESVEVTQEDGSIKKVAVFRHTGFVKA